MTLDRAMVLEAFRGSDGLAVYAFAVEPGDWRGFVAAVVEEGLAVEEEGRLTIALGPARIRSAGLYDGELELELDPAEWNEGNLDRLFGFLRVVGGALGRDVFVTRDASPEDCIVALRLDQAALAAPRRPPARTPFGADLATRITSFLTDLGDAATIAPSEATSARFRWRAVYRPDQYAWHTDLTADEFLAARAIWAVLGASSIEPPDVRRQLVEAIDRARQLFDA